MFRYGTALKRLRNIYIGRSTLREPGALHISPIEAGTLTLAGALAEGPPTPLSQGHMRSKPEV